MGLNKRKELLVSFNIPNWTNDPTADPSPLDKLLEQVKALVDQYLPILGPIIGLTKDQVDAVVSNFDKFVADVEALEAGSTDISTGIEAIATDLLEILKALGADITNPSK